VFFHKKMTLIVFIGHIIGFSGFITKAEAGTNSVHVRIIGQATNTVCVFALYDRNSAGVEFDLTPTAFSPSGRFTGSGEFLANVTFLVDYN